MSTQDCKFCNRKGLPFLPMRLAYAPSSTSTLPGTLTQGNTNLMPVADGSYALRVINDGFVYMLDMRAGGFWRCFAATASGHFKELPLDAPPLQNPTFQCGRTGHGSVASLISIEHASEAGDVWVGYSRVWWTKETRAKVKSNASLRGTLMVSINARSVVTGADVPVHSGLRINNSAQLSTLAGEYADTDAAFKLIDQRYASKTTTAAVPRHGQADTLVKTMHGISPNNAVILALPDTIGIVQDINHWRNLQAGELAKYQGDSGKLRSRIVGDLILNLEKGMKQQGQAETWSKRYATKVSMSKVRADKSSHDAKIKSLESKIIKASQDWCAWSNKRIFQQVWSVYDGTDKRCGLAMERDFAHCVFGSGGTKPEQNWWAQWLTAPPDDEDHALWLAFAAGDKDAVAFLKGDAAKPLDVGKTDKGFDIAKNSREVALKLHEWLQERKAKSLLRIAQNESGLLANTVAAQLQILARTKPDQALQAGQRLRVVIASRIEVTIRPHAQTMTMQQLVVQMHEAVWGPPTAKLSSTVREARSLKIAQSVDGAWLGSRFTSTKVVTVDAWIPDPAVKLGAAPASSMKALPGISTPLALPRPALNTWQGMTQYLKSLKRTGGALMGLGTALQISNMSATLIQLDRAMKGNAANKDDVITESLYGVVSGSLGLSALTSEIFAGTLAARISINAVATTTATKLLSVAGWTALGGGALGVASAVVDGAQAFRKGLGLLDEGDKDAAISSFAVVGVSTLAAIGSGALAVIGAGALVMKAGATGAAASVLLGTAGILSVIPVAGWILLVIGATIAGIYFAYKASTEEDTALEKWLSRCYWRDDTKYGKSTRAKFSDLKSEMVEFQQAIYGINVALNWNDRWGKDEVEVNVTMPGYGKGSEYAFLLELSGPKWKRTLVHRKTSAFSADTDLMPQPPTQTYISAPTPGVKYTPMSEVLEFSEPFSFTLQGGMALFAGKVRVNEDYFNSAKLKFEYWPDATNMPDLKMLPVPGGANFAEATD